MPNKLKMCITNMIVETKVKVKYTSILFVACILEISCTVMEVTGRLSAYGVLLKTKYLVVNTFF